MFNNYPDIMTVKDIQNALQIGRNAAYTLLKTGAIKSFKIDGKSQRILKSDLIAYISNKAAE
jgi:predicted site-specific integrase-resolvase